MTTSDGEMATSIHRHLLQFKALLNVEEHQNIISDLDRLVGSIEAKFDVAKEVDVDKGPGTAEVQIVAPSGILQTMQLSIREPAAETMRKSLKSIGKEAKGIFVFTLGATIVEEGWSLEKLGVTAGSNIEMTALDSLRPCFEWGFYDPSTGSEILEKGATFRRGSPSNFTSGVRTRAALPRDTLCYVSFDEVGTHADLGVGTFNCRLRPSDTDEHPWVHLFGQDENSWALCFAQGSQVSAEHKGQSCDMEDLNGKWVESPMIPTSRLVTSRFVFSFLISASGQMLVTLPGQSQELVVPFEIPQDLEVFVVASVAMSLGTISISSVPPQPQDA